MKTTAAALLILAACLAATVPAAAQVPPPPPPLGAPLPGLTPAELQSFQDGRAQFTRVFAPIDGLGPVFNDNSCVPCHGGPAPGGGSARVVTRFGRAKGRSFDPLADLGGSLIQERALGGPPCLLVPEVVPAEANVVALRRSTSIFGLGLVDAVDDATLTALAAAQRQVSRRTAGRTSQVTNLETGLPRVGRFGWKAQVGTLSDFSADAMLNEIGLTNPTFPDESCPQGDCSLLSCNPRPGLNDDGTIVALMTAFQTLLAPPPRGPITPQVTQGEAVFHSIGCGGCHVDTIETGDSDIAALDHVAIHPYSDFLLHDMGRLGDGIVQGDAGATEMRTAPLWGLRFVRAFLHDGRAVTIEEAIEAHEGQGATARREFGRLGATDRSNLLAFLQSL